MKGPFKVVAFSAAILQNCFCVHAQIVTNSEASGPGSLAQVFAAAPAGATIRFDPSLAGVYIASDSLVINKDITLDATGLTKRPKLIDTSLTIEVAAGAHVRFLFLEIQAILDNGGQVGGENLTVSGIGAFNAAVINKVGGTLNLISSDFAYDAYPGIANKGGTLFAQSVNYLRLESSGGSVTLDTVVGSIFSSGGSISATNCHFQADELSRAFVQIDAGSFAGSALSLIGDPAPFNGTIGFKIGTNAVVRLQDSDISWHGSGAIVNSGALSLTNVTLNQNCGAIANATDGTIVMANCSLDRNRVAGAVQNAGSLTIVDSSITATREGGGGIYNSGRLNLTNVVISGNSDGIFNTGNINAEKVHLNDNQAGLHSSKGDIVLVDSTILRNAGLAPAGIATSVGDLTLVRTIVSSNISSSVSGDCSGGIGAGGSSDSGHVKIIDSLVSNNQSPGIFCVTPDGNRYNTEGGAGGVSVAGDLELIRSTISSNLGNGLLHSGGVATLLQSTIVGNSESGQSRGSFDFFHIDGGKGGGILSSGILRITNCTIFGNIASAPNFGTPFANGGGIYFTGSEFSLQNSIVCSNRADFNPNIFGAFAGDHNLIGVDPRLAPLGNNGGPTPTLLPLSDSPALNAAKLTTLATDQRGFASPISLFPDIGAVESQSILPLQMTVETNASGAVAIHFKAASGLRIRIYELADLDHNVTPADFIGYASEDSVGSGAFTFSLAGVQSASQRFFALVPEIAF